MLILIYKGEFIMENIVNEMVSKLKGKLLEKDMCYSI